MTANLCFGRTMCKCLLGDYSLRIFWTRMAGTIVTVGKLYQHASSTARHAGCDHIERPSAEDTVLAHSSQPNSLMSLATAAEI